MPPNPRKTLVLRLAIYSRTAKSTVKSSRDSICLNPMQCVKCSTHMLVVARHAASLRADSSINRRFASGKSAYRRIISASRSSAQ